MATITPTEKLSERAQQILCGLFLSKYDQAALKYLGFKGFSEAFNTLGYGLGARPASIKNYRDELDPFLSTKRMGWHKRPLRDHCKRIIDNYSGATLEELGCLIKRLLDPIEALQHIPKVGKVLKRFEGADSSFAKRLMTGRAAEEYFLHTYESMPEFTGQCVTNTTLWGCGFDFQLRRGNEDAFSVVEVKGMRNRSGQLQMTELEYSMAETLADKFFLVVVRNFAEKPFHSVFQNPLCCDLTFQRFERREPRVFWQTNLTA